MIFFRFVGWKYCLYLAAASLCLGGLYTLVEVLEKLARYRDLSLGAVGHYAAVTFIPSFISLFPLSSLVAVGLLMREWMLHEYPTIIGIYGISPRRLIKAVGICSMAAAACVALLHEGIGYKSARRMAQAKVWLFKRGAPSTAEWRREGAAAFMFSTGGGVVYLLEGGQLPRFIRGWKQQDGTVEGKELNFKRQVLQPVTYLLNEKAIDALTYQQAEVALQGVINLLNARYGQQLLADFLYFFLKIILLPILGLVLFFFLFQRPFVHWVGLVLPYPVVGVAYSCLQLLGPLQGLSLLLIGVMFLFGYFWEKL